MSILCFGVWSSADWAQEPAVPASAPSPVPPAAADDEPPAADTLASTSETAPPSFTIRLVAPDSVRDLLARHLELERYRRVPDLDRSELARLLAVSASSLRQLLATQGYFTPNVTQRVLADSQTAIPEVRIDVDPGERTRIEAPELELSGEIANYPSAAAQMTEIRRRWGLLDDEYFTQDAWSDAKTRGLRDLQNLRFPSARLVTSEAEIDSDAQRARLRALYDSGPVYRLGPVQVEGDTRYAAAIARRLARLKSGADYDQRELLAAQQRLIDSGYYRGAYIRLDTSPEADPRAAPVRIEVQEARLQKLVLGGGISTDRGLRASIEHTHNSLPWLGWRATSKLEADKEERAARLGLLAPPDENLWRWLTNATLRRETKNGYRQDTQQFKAGRTKLEGGIDRTWYGQYDRSRAYYPPQAAEDAQSLSAHYVWTYRRFDSLILPRSGYGVALEAGAGMTLRPTRHPFTRVLARYQGFFPLDGDVAAGVRRALPLPAQIKAIAVGDADAQALAHPLAEAAGAGVEGGTVPRQIGELVLRLEVGGVTANSAASVPADLLFLTGGDATVRGYAYHQIGVSGGYGATEAGRYLLAGSLEYRRPFRLAGKPTDWDTVLFVDAGSVTDRLGKFKPKVGVGAGTLWRSPIGPVQMALAWGVQSRQLRLHLNLGFNF